MNKHGNCLRIYRDLVYITAIGFTTPSYSGT